MFWVNELDATDGFWSFLNTYSNSLTNVAKANKAFMQSGTTYSMGIDSPFFFALGFLKYGAQGVSNLVKIGEISDDVIVFSSKFGDEVVEGMANFKMVGDKLHLNGLHLQGSSAGKVGRVNMWEMAKDLGKQFNAKQVIIQGGKRTTGKYKGKIPSPITINVN